MNEIETYFRSTRSLSSAIPKIFKAKSSPFALADLQYLSSNTDFPLPSPSTLAEWHNAAAFIVMHAKSEQFTKRARFFTLSTDSSERNCRELLPISISFFDELTQQIAHCLLGVVDLGKNKTAKNMRDSILWLLEEFQLDPARMRMLLSDNTASMSSNGGGLMGLLSAFAGDAVHAPCALHVLHLSLQRAETHLFGGATPSPANRLKSHAANLMWIAFWYFGKVS